MSKIKAVMITFTFERNRATGRVDALFLKQKARLPLWSATLNQMAASDGSMWMLPNNKNSLARHTEERGQRRDRGEKWGNNKGKADFRLKVTGLRVYHFLFCSLSSLESWKGQENAIFSHPKNEVAARGLCRSPNVISKSCFESKYC